MLENPTEAVNDTGYFDCIDSVMENSKVHILRLVSSYFFACCFGSVNDTDGELFLVVHVYDSVVFGVQVLGEAMAGISHNAKNSNLPEFGDAVSSASKALCGLTEAATQVNKHHRLRACVCSSVCGFFSLLVCCNQHIREVATSPDDSCLISST